MPRKPTAGLAAAFLAAFALATGCPAHAYDDLKIPLKLPSAAALGTYTGPARITVGAVTDQTFSEGPSHLGMGPQASYEIVSDGTRPECVRQGVAEALKLAGVLADAPSAASHTLELTILRDHVHTHASFGRWRLRSEVFLEFSLVREGVREGWVLAAGTAETYAQVASEAKLTQNYQIGFNDAVHKFLNSRALARVLGEGWKPGAAPAQSGEYNTTRIHKDEFYGPSEFILAEVPRAKKALEGRGPYEALYLPDFGVQAIKGKTKGEDIAQSDFAKAFLPELVREHLNAFFPGAFAAIRRGEAVPEKPGIALGGVLDSFQIGDFAKRVIIGFGAGKDKLEGTLSLGDSATGQEIYPVKILSSNWGAGWQVKRGHIRDMADQLARDFAYLLVQSAAPGYKPPEALEILFDETPYPTQQRKT